MAEIKDEKFNELLAEMEAEEGGAETPKEEVTDITETAEGKKEHESEGAAATEEVEEVEEKTEAEAEAEYYPHIKIMREEKINRKSLPKEIREMITAFNRKRSMAERNNGKDSTFLQLRNLSAIIADKLVDWLEKDYDGEQRQPTVSSKKEEVELELEKDDEFDDDEDFEDDEEEEEEGGKNKGGLFEGVLGGIFDY